MFLWIAILVHHFASDWNSSTPAWITIRSGRKIHDFGDPLTFPVVPPIFFKRSHGRIFVRIYFLSKYFRLNFLRSPAFPESDILFLSWQTGSCDPSHCLFPFKIHGGAFIQSDNSQKITFITSAMHVTLLPALVTCHFAAFPSTQHRSGCRSDQSAQCSPWLSPSAEIGAA